MRHVSAAHQDLLCGLLLPRVGLEFLVQSQDWGLQIWGRGCGWSVSSNAKVGLWLATGCVRGVRSLHDFGYDLETDFEFVSIKGSAV